MRYIFLFFILLKSLLFSFDYPNKSIEFVVGLGEGGSADRMTRNMAALLQKELGVHINVKTIKTNGSLDAANYVLKEPHDGYKVFCSTFSPYLLNLIISKKADFSLNDFEIINLQWFEQDFIAVGKDSEFNSIVEILNYIKKNPKELKVALINKSSGHILFKLLLEKFNIPFKDVDIKLYNGGGSARKALLESKVDLLIIAAQGSEKYREYIKPLAIVSNKPSKRWDAPTLNDTIKDTGITMPIIHGPIRGIAVSKKFKEDFPHRFRILENAIKKTLAKKSVHRYLKRKNIGYTWIGSQNSKKILQNSYEDFKKFNYLIED
ncbi:tripartite tricarboxylate transporter substrate-binding protein [Halarcobacter sp.]|uniref:tripartite tricarboxylate transporter substrate-binding protein n=1 Tax=Halarcobacter sp. TaxID=2321133 RepID=UPI002AA91B3D|nr:tripartite tricarboxylate transporter substrate-binding protein [Halarcobacter sp.]